MGTRALCCALVVSAAAVGLAGVEVSWVRGRVTDPEGLPLPGVLITVTSAVPRPGAGAATSVTDAQGRFTVQVAPGDYRLTAELSGFERIDQSVTVGAGAAVELDLHLHLAGFQERVTVRGEAPQTVIGDPRPAAPVTATREVVESGMLPNSQYDDVLPLLPNVVRGPDGSISVAGASAPQGGLLVNGANLTDPISGEAVLLLPLESVDSVEVFSGGYPADAGRATGGVTSVHTVAGGDRWRMSANSFFPRIRFVGGKPEGVDSWEPNVGFSGPLFDGRLSVEQGISYRYDRNRFETLWGEQNSAYAALMSWSQADWRVSDGQHVSATLSFDPQRIDHAGITAFTSSTSAPQVERGGWSVGAADRLTVGRNSEFELRLSAVRGRLSVTPDGTAPYEVGHDVISGSYFDRRDLQGTRLEAGGVWSWTAPSGHQVKLGVSMNHETADGSEGAGTVSLLDSAGRLARSITFLPTVAPVSEYSNEAGFFAQDRWTVSPRITVDAGARYDWSSSARPAFSPRVAWTVKLPLGETTFGGSAGIFADKIPLEAQAFQAGQPRLVQSWDEAGTMTSAVLFTNVAAATWDTPTATRWNLELGHRFGGGWQARVKYQERHGRNELVVDPRMDSAQTGSLVLSSTGLSNARSLELTTAYRAPRGGHELYLSFVRSATDGSTNTLQAIQGIFREPYIQPDVVARLPADVPNRFLAWGIFHLPARISVSPFLEIRSGFPYTPIDESWNYVGDPNSARLPWFGSLDLYVNKVFSLSHGLPDARIGLKLYNVVWVHTERDVQRGVARPDFGQTYNPIPRDFTLVFELLWGRK